MKKEKTRVFMDLENPKKKDHLEKGYLKNFVFR